MSSTTRKITLKSSDGKTFEVSEAVAVALESQTIKHMMEDNFGENGILIPNVNGKILAKVIEYCKMHVEAGWDADFVKVDHHQATLFKHSNSYDLKVIELCKKHVEDELKAWDAEFVKQFDMETLCDIFLAAKYLNIKGLHDLTSEAVARRS